MANRNFNRYQALTKEVKVLFARIAIGSTGAPALQSPYSLGVTSVVRNSTGNYTITLDDKYMHLMQITQSIQLASGSPAATGGMVIRSHTVSTTKQIIVEFVDSSGAAVELPSGAQLRLSIELKNSSVTR